MVRANGQSYCLDPAGGVLRVLGRTWSLPLIGVLGNLPVSRFNEIQDAIEGVGSKVLARRLRDLAQLGLVARTIYPEVPARVEYRLTERGIPVLRHLPIENFG